MGAGCSTECFDPAHTEPGKSKIITAADPVPNKPPRAALTESNVVKQNSTPGEEKAPEKPEKGVKKDFSTASMGSIPDYVGGQKSGHAQYQNNLMAKHVSAPYFALLFVLLI